VKLTMGGLLIALGLFILSGWLFRQSIRVMRNQRDLTSGRFCPHCGAVIDGDPYDQEHR
jgi:hypothetical protein